MNRLRTRAPYTKAVESKTNKKSKRKTAKASRRRNRK